MPEQKTLTPTMERHLRELLNAPYWTPIDPGEWSVARALERRGYLVRLNHRGDHEYALTRAGRLVAADLPGRTERTASASSAAGREAGGGQEAEER
jgi:hypothetical protein